VHCLCTTMKLYMQSSFWLSCKLSSVITVCCTSRMRCLQCVCCTCRVPQVRRCLTLLVTSSLTVDNKHNVGYRNGQDQPQGVAKHTNALIPHALRDQLNKISSINDPWGGKKDRVKCKTFLSVILSISCLLNLLSCSGNRDLCLHHYAHNVYGTNPVSEPAKKTLLQRRSKLSSNNKT
jgi:hypothetical protein